MDTEMGTEMKMKTDTLDEEETTHVDCQSRKGIDSRVLASELFTKVLWLTCFLFCLLCAIFSEMLVLFGCLNPKP